MVRMILAVVGIGIFSQCTTTMSAAGSDRSVSALRKNSEVSHRQGGGSSGDSRYCCGPSQGMSQALVSSDSAASSSFTVFARCTRFSHTENGDAETRQRKSKTELRLKYADETSSGMGFAAVDPNIIPLGSTIVSEDGRRYFAGDIGGSVHGRTAAIRLALREKRQAVKCGEQYDYELHANAVVIDLFVRDGEKIPDWSRCKIIPPNISKPFLAMSVAERQRYLDLVEAEQLAISKMLAYQNSRIAIARG